MKSIYDYVKEQAMNRNISIKKMCSEIGISYQAIYLFKKHRKQLSMLTLRKIAIYFDEDFDYIKKLNKSL